MVEEYICKTMLRDKVQNTNDLSVAELRQRIMSIVGETTAEKGRKSQYADNGVRTGKFCKNEVTRVLQHLHEEEPYIGVGRSVDELFERVRKHLGIDGVYTSPKFRKDELRAIYRKIQSIQLNEQEQERETSIDGKARNGKK